MYATQPKATQSQEAVVNILSFNTETLNVDGDCGRGILPPDSSGDLLMSNNSLNVPNCTEILTTVILFYMSDRCLSAF